MSEPQVFEMPPSISQSISADDELKQWAESKRKRRGRPPKAESEQSKQWAEPKSTGQPQVVTQEMLEPIIIGIMQTLGSVLDESFEVLDPKTGAKDPRITVASANMLPWAQKYGGVLLGAAPWLGFLTGMLILAGPGLNATVEMAAGVRKPRIMRTSPEDIYTNKYKKASQQTIDGQIVKSVNNERPSA